MDLGTESWEQDRGALNPHAQVIFKVHVTHSPIHHRWKVIHKTGPFSRSAGLQAGLDYVQVSECRYLASFSGFPAFSVAKKAEKPGDEAMRVAQHPPLLDGTGNGVPVMEYQASSMQDLNSIVMTIDMHLAIPPGFIEYTRRVHRHFNQQITC